jgi:hypothetical protein
MCSGWKFERDYEPACIDHGFCGNYWHPAELGCELLLFLRFVRCVSGERIGIEKASCGIGWWHFWEAFLWSTLGALEAV